MRGLVLSLAVFVLLPVSSGSARPTATATVRVPDTTPFVVRGSRFKARENVRVVALVEGRHVKTTVATTTGAFTARFPGVSVRACMAYIVRATGSKGSVAYLRHRPACPGD
jgi:hypothetical protein